MKRREKVLNDAVLVFLVKNGKVLLATKGENIGKGKLNGYGGGIEKGETPTVAAIRELEEETRGERSIGIVVDRKDLQKMGIMNFHNTTKEGIVFMCRVHIFIATKWNGEIISTKDMIDPKWYNIKNIPLVKMMPADKIWMPKIFFGRKIIGEAKYGPRQKELIGEVKISQVDSFFED